MARSVSRNTCTVSGGKLARRARREPWHPRRWTCRNGEVRVLAAAAVAVASVEDGDESRAIDLINIATELGVWDPVVCALRTSQSLSTLLASHADLQPLLQDIYARSNDLGLARKAGFRTRSTLAPDQCSHRANSKCSN